MNRDKFNFNGKKILIVGMGKSGLAVLDYLKNKGAEIFIQDSKKLDEFDGEQIMELASIPCQKYFGAEPEDVKAMDLIVLSPGVPVTLTFLQEAKEAGVEIIGELELAYRQSEGKFVAITGTNGKTTTTTLVYEIFREAGFDARLVGNIGNPAIAQVEDSDADTWFITEVSSFQLDSVKEFSPKISAILNLTPDHLDRHGSIESYAKTKAKINRKQTENDFCVVNFDDPVATTLAKGTKAKVVTFSKFNDIKFGTLVIGGKILVLDSEENSNFLCYINDVAIMGSHNLENALAAATICFFAGVSAEIIGKVLKSFKGVPHRLEDCGYVKGVHFINDSKATNTDAAIKALNAIGGKIILIAGGYDKKANFDSFIAAFENKVKHLILIGTTAVKIKNAAEQKDYENNIILPNMQEAVKEAFRRAEEGDTILLSPACASWDQYKNFEYRGDDFKLAVEKLKA